MRMRSLAALTACLFGLPATADVMPFGQETWSFEAGVFLPSFKTDVSVDPAGETNPATDLEDLGLDTEQSTYHLRANWRFHKKHHLTLSFFETSRTASKALQQELEIDDETILVGANVDTSFRMRSFPIVYSYSFKKSERHEIAASAGIHWYTFDFGLSADAFVDDMTGSTDGTVTADADAPMPMFGLRYAYYPADNWTIGLHGEWFGIDLGNDLGGLSGQIVNFRANAEYGLFDNFGVGLAVNYFEMDLDVSDDGWRGQMDYGYIGPQIYLSVRF